MPEYRHNTQQQNKSMARCFSWAFIVRSQVQRDTGAAFPKPSKHKVFVLLWVMLREVPFLRSSKNHVWWNKLHSLLDVIKLKTISFLRVGSSRGLSRNWRGNMVLFRVENRFVCVFSSHYTFCVLLGLASALFFGVTQRTSRSSSILRVWSGTTRTRCRVWF